MDKETLLNTYVDIETNTYIRSDKNKKLNDLIDLLKTNEEKFTLGDILSIVNDLFDTQITIRHPFFLHIIYPILSKGVEDNNIEAIKQLVKLFNDYGGFQNFIKDNKHTIWTLLKKGLQLSPYDNELLTIYKSRQESYFEYTLHELPSGVLYGSDGATIEQCSELLNDVADYEEVCKRLSLDKQELINDCKLYYNSYKSYLTVCKSYNSFEDYLEQHGIPDR